MRLNARLAACVQVGFFDDKLGPIVVASVVQCALLAILCASVRDVFFR